MTEEMIYEGLMETFTEATGYEMNGEADLAVRLRAAARQIMSLYHYADYVLRQAFPQTASGECLNRQGEIRGVTRKGAAKATGNLTFSMSSAQTVERIVPVGTVCMTDQMVKFVTTAQGKISAGSLSVTVPAAASETGSSGNVLAGTIVQMQTMPTGIQRVTNSAAFSGGRDPESDEEYRSRIMTSYKGISNGMNESFYRQTALAVEGVDRVEVIPRINGVGSVGVVVDCDSGTISDSTVSKVQTELAKNREICLELVVSKPTTKSVNISAKIAPKTGYTLSQARTAVQKAITGYFGTLSVGRPVYLSALIHAAMASNAIDNIAIVSPSADVAAGNRERIRAGTLTLEAQ